MITGQSSQETANRVYIIDIIFYILFTYLFIYA